MAHGIGGHASLPDGTVNAIALIVGYLRESGILGAGAVSALDLLERIHADTAGSAIGIATQSSAFGPLTCNAGTIALTDDGALEQTIDVRFPDSITEGELAAACSALAKRFGGAVEVDRTKPPFSVDATSPQVRALIDIYNQTTGRDAKPFAMGGGTYARNFKSAVSFGPEDNGMELPEWAGTMHGPNEAASEQLLREALKMYILAILRLMELDYDE